ncbi:hypothetical protein C8T65DRAFT_834461 [Cerioporus squamosus]|nr:hypothetical protein C8T65DRAFT_834461 [Cerioporus squamosus]
MDDFMVSLSDLIAMSDAPTIPRSPSPLPPSSPLRDDRSESSDCAEHEEPQQPPNNEVQPSRHEQSHSFSFPPLSSPPRSLEPVAESRAHEDRYSPRVMDRRNQSRADARTPEPTGIAASSDPGVLLTSPIVANLFESKKDVSRRKALKKRKQTMAAKKATREANLAQEGQAAVEANRDAAARAEHEAAKARDRCFKEVLGQLQEGGYGWGEFVEWISRPSSGHKQQRYEGLFRCPERVHRILDLWATRNTSTGKRAVHSWAVSYVGKVVSREAHAVTKSGFLHSRNKSMTESFLSSFDLSSIHTRLRSMCPTATSILRSFSTTSRQKKVEEKGVTGEKTDALLGKRQERNDRRVGMAMVELLGERSQNNSFVKHVVGLYLYATGASRQLISVLSSLGVCSSYPSIAGSGDTVKAAEEEMAHDAGTQDEDSDEEDLDWVPNTSDSESDTGSEDSEPEEDELEASAESIEQLAAGGADTNVPDAIEDTIEDAIEPDARASMPEAPTTVTALLDALLSRGAGLLRRISHACRRSTRCLAQSCLCGHVYDNINMIFKVAEQILGRKDSQENGTCATIFPLFDAQEEDMRTSDLLESLDKAPPLSIDDILHTPEEAELFEQSLEHTVLRMIVFNSEHLSRFKADVHTSLPGTDDQIPLHQTDVHPLPAMQIDESSIVGNAEVMDAMFSELGFDIGTTKFSGIARPVFGDQLSIARLRTLIANRAGHDTLANSYAYVVFGPGFFHHQMALAHGIIETHFGDPEAGNRNPACLSFLNTALDRKPIVLTSLPPYRPVRDLILHAAAAYARVGLEDVSKCKSFEEYCKNVTFDELRVHVKDVYHRLCSPNKVAELRRAREAEIAERTRQAAATPRKPDDPPFDPLAEPLKTGDMLFENASLFFRDALIMSEFNDAIKGGYSGRIIRVLKALALMYRGSGRTKYAHELLHLVHNLTQVWPKPLRDVIIKNWLVNPTGRPNNWVPVDLLQEHMNFWIKVIYKAQGSNASWEWLKVISPVLGARLGTKHHTPEMARDLATLRDTLRVHDVLKVTNGRALRGVKNAVIPNVMNVGLTQLFGPLNEYNRTFKQLQRRRREVPLADIAQSGTASTTTPQPEQQTGGEEDEEWYWRAFDDEDYDPRAVFAEEENPSLDIDDY